MPLGGLHKKSSSSETSAKEKEKEAEHVSSSENNKTPYLELVTHNTDAQHEKLIWCSDFSKNGPPRFACGSYDTHISIFSYDDQNTSEFKCKLEQKTKLDSDARSVRFSKDPTSSKLIVATEAGSIYIFDLSSKDKWPHWRFAKHAATSDTARCADFSEDLSLIASGGCDNFARLWRCKEEDLSDGGEEKQEAAEKRKPLIEYPAQSDFVYCLQFLEPRFSQQGLNLFTCNYKGEILRLDTKEGKLLKAYGHHDGKCILSFALARPTASTSAASPEGRIVSCSYDKQAKVVDILSGEVLFTFGDEKIHKTLVVVQTTFDGKFAAFAGETGIVTMINCELGQIVAYANPANQVGANPGGPGEGEGGEKTQTKTVSFSPKQRWMLADRTATNHSNKSAGDFGFVIFKNQVPDLLWAERKICWLLREGKSKNKKMMSLMEIYAVCFFVCKYVA